jgi:hypothetical protein
MVPKLRNIRCGKIMQRIPQGAPTAAKVSDASVAYNTVIPRPAGA